MRLVLAGAATAAALVATLSLGFWQLARAAEKQAMQTAQTVQAQLPELNSTQLFDAAQAHALLHRRIALQGRWLAASTVFLENRQMNAKPGFFVLTPLKPEPSGPTLLVIRGWAPRHFQDRAALPAVATPAGLVRVYGVLAEPPSKLYEFGGEGRGPIRQNLDMTGYAAELGQPLFALALRQQDDAGSGAGNAASDGLLRQWPQVDRGVDKHHAYALQWFALAALIGGLYLWFQIVQPLRSRR